MAVENNSKLTVVIKSTTIGVLNNICFVALTLISRKLFLRFIGIEYLGIGQIINNILSILAFSELGIGNSVLYMLYKPVANEDNLMIKKIIVTYKKMNRIIGCVIFGLGILCIPFLHLFIHTSIPNETVYIIFLMNLIYIAGTYFCSYRAILLSANQKDYIASYISLGVSFVNIIMQCIIIVMTKSYIVYLLVTIVTGVLQNVMTYFVVGKLYPFIKEAQNESLNDAEKKELVTNVKSMFSVKFAAIVINNTDNILVSWIDTIMVGMCTNYTTISLRIKGIINIFHNAIVHSLGIASVEKSADEKYFLFKKIMLVNTFLAGVITVSLGILWNDFIILWIGKKYLVSSLIIWSLLINFIWNVVIAPVWMFRDTNGLFIYVKKMLILNAVTNIVLSVILGNITGVAGVYFATVLADIITDFWFDSRLLYEKVFGRKDFYKYIVFVIANIAVVFIFIYLLNIVFLKWKVSILNWIIKGILAVILYTIIFMLVYIQTDTAKDIINSIILPRIKRKERC